MVRFGLTFYLSSAEKFTTAQAKWMNALLSSINIWINYLRRVIHQLLVRVVLRVESKEFHAVGHQLSKYMKNNTIVNQG